MGVRTSTSFKPGNNANPKGRPKKEWTMKGLIEEALEEEDEKGVPYKKLIAKKLRILAVKGDMTAIKEVNNRLDGMPMQKTDLTTDGEPLRVIITEDKKEDEDNKSSTK